MTSLHVYTHLRSTSARLYMRVGLLTLLLHRSFSHSYHLCHYAGKRLACHPMLGLMPRGYQMSAPLGLALTCHLICLVSLPVSVCLCLCVGL